MRLLALLIEQAAPFSDANEGSAPGNEAGGREGPKTARCAPAETIGSRVGGLKYWKMLLALDHDAARFDKAAVRWHARLCREAPLTLDEAQLALSALRALPGPSREAASGALLGLPGQYQLQG